MKISCEYYSFWPLGEYENKGFEPIKWIQRLVTLVLLLLENRVHPPTLQFLNNVKFFFSIRNWVFGNLPRVDRQQISSISVLSQISFSTLFAVLCRLVWPRNSHFQNCFTHLSLGPLLYSILYPFSNVHNSTTNVHTNLIWIWDTLGGLLPRSGPPVPT